MRYVEDRSLSLGDVAFLLGYSNQSAFSAAFKRWVGRAPVSSVPACIRLG